MTWTPPDYLQIPRESLGRGCPMTVRVVGDSQDLADGMARAILETIRDCQQAGRPATLILPVGPVDQFPILATLINEQKIDCRDVVIINMDEYLSNDDQCVALDHPLSFRGFMN